MKQRILRDPIARFSIKSTLYKVVEVKNHILILICIQFTLIMYAPFLLDVDSEVECLGRGFRHFLN